MDKFHTNILAIGRAACALQYTVLSIQQPFSILYITQEIGLGNGVATTGTVDKMFFDICLLTSREAAGSLVVKALERVALYKGGDKRQCDEPIVATALEIDKYAVADKGKHIGAYASVLFTAGNVNYSIYNPLLLVATEKSLSRFKDNILCSLLSEAAQTVAAALQCR